MGNDDGANIIKSVSLYSSGLGRYLLNCFVDNYPDTMLDAMNSLLSPFIASSWVTTFSVSILGIFSWYYVFVRRHPKVYYSAATRAANLVMRMSNLLLVPYAPTPWASNRHLNTFFATLIRKHPKIHFTRELFKVSDGGLVALDWYNDPHDRISGAAPILFILPGLSGSSDSIYVKHIITETSNLKMQCVVFINRGISGLPLLTPRAYCAASTSDVRETLLDIKSRYNNRLIYAIGFSFGGNLLVKYLGQDKDRVPLQAAISVGNPYDLKLSSKKLSTSLYSNVLCKDLIVYYSTHKDMISQNPNVKAKKSQITSVTCITDFDSLVTAPMFGYSSVDQYYEDASCVHDMKDVSIPLLCISARDDPIVDSKAIPINLPQSNDNVIIVVTSHGGHLGFLEGWLPTSKNWADRVVKCFLGICLNDDTKLLLNGD